LFLDHVEGVEAVHVAQQDVASGARRLDHDIDSRLLHRGRLRAQEGIEGEKNGTGALAGRAVYHSRMNHDPSRGPAEADRIRIVLVGTQHPGNIGPAARALKTMGLSRLASVPPQRFPHPDAEALAAGADDVRAGASRVETLAEAVADCRLVLGCTARSRRVPLEELPPRLAAARARAAALAGAEVALVFGRERTGLEN